MKVHLLSLLMVGVCGFSTLGSVANAGNIPADFDQKKFQHVMDFAGATGEWLKSDIYEYRILTHLDPSNATKPHKADYFGDVGGMDSAGHFGVMQVIVESEDWRKRPNGDWEIEQWSWTADTDGSLISVTHDLLIENAGGSVISLNGLPVGEASDAAEIARWGAMLKEWNLFVP